MPVCQVPCWWWLDGQVKKTQAAGFRSDTNRGQNAPISQHVAAIGGYHVALLAILLPPAAAKWARLHDQVLTMVGISLHLQLHPAQLHMQTPCSLHLAGENDLLHGTGTRELSKQDMSSHFAQARTVAWWANQGLLGSSSRPSVPNPRCIAKVR